MTKASNIPAIEETTKLSWKEWLKFLDGVGAKDLSHRQIADKVYGKLEGKLENAGWWSQSVTVAYEQHIGRRAPGQRADGSYEISVSKTIDGNLDHAMDLWTTIVSNMQEFSGVAFKSDPTQTTPKSGRHWGVNLIDGTRITADCYPKTSDKTIFTVTHLKLESADSAERWRTYWKSFFETL